ncbi:MAG: peptidylprolyl isomerase [Oscillospiraceae bacterium]
MGASKEKKKRVGYREEGLDWKSKKLAEEEKARKKSNIKHWVIGSLTVIIIAVIIVFGSNITYKYFTAVKAGDVGYSSADYNYYYYTTYNNYYSSYYNSYGDYAQYFMPSEADLKQDTLDTMQEVALLTTEAKAAGYTLPQEGLDSVDQAISTYKSAASQNNYSSLGSFLAAYYGKGMSEKIFVEDMTDYLTASYYAKELVGSYEYTSDELSAYYDENKDDFDNFTFRYFYFDGSAVEADEENGVEAVDSETAMANAKALADEFLGKITDESSFTALAYSYADENSKSSYQDPDYSLVTYQGSYISSNMPNVYDWIIGSGRTEGETTVAESTSGYYVVYYISRADNDYATVDARHILIAPVTVNKDDYTTDEEYQAAVTAASDAAKEKADEVYTEWKNGDMTEESFAALADQYSGDTGSNNNGGLYEKIYKGQMLTEFNDWVFNSSRKAGDTGIIQTSYGYHIIYFVGTDMTYNDYLADSAKREEQYSTWKEENLVDYPVSTNWFLNWGTKKETTSDSGSTDTSTGTDTAAG